MLFSPPRVSLNRTTVFCAIGLLLACPSFGQDNHPNDYIRSTRPLKSGGSITTLSSQGATRSWVNQSAATPQGPVASRDGGDQKRSAASTSFYRQAQSRNSDAETYPYPGAALPSTTGTASRFAQDQQAQLRFERGAVGDLNTGDLGNTAPATDVSASFERAAATTPPAARVAQAPAGSGSRSTNSVVNPDAAAAAFRLGPNYVNPNLNFAGYQGFQPNAIAANSVPALNANIKRVAQNCCGNGQNCCCTCQPQSQQQTPPFRPFPIAAQTPVGNTSLQASQSQGYRFQPNIGVPQLGGNTGGIGSRLYSWLNGARNGTSSNGLASAFLFRNMPPGAYLGQGIIGQPTAYVDGQPFRNLFRYVAP